MHAPNSLVTLEFASFAFAAASLFLIFYRREARKYHFLCVLLGLRVCLFPAFFALYWFAGHGISRHLAYQLYFYTYWSGFAIESILGFLLIYSIFNTAMAPLEGIQSLGRIVFFWAGGVSCAVSIGSAFASKTAGAGFAVNFVSGLMRTQSILTLCLLLFVCFAIRPLGLSYRSRIFGVNLGLGLIATANLVAGAWLPNATSQMNFLINLGSDIATCGAFLLWIGYFALPEPKRRMVILPTTSPFLRWNQISKALGDEPGYVAVGGIPPDLFAPAELEVMRRASRKMVQPQSTVAVAAQHSQRSQSA